MRCHNPPQPANPLYTVLNYNKQLLSQMARTTGPMYFVFSRLYPSFPQPPRQFLAPTWHLSTLNKHCIASAGLPIHMFGEVSWDPIRRKKMFVGLLVFNPLCSRRMSGRRPAHSERDMVLNCFTLESLFRGSVFRPINVSENSRNLKANILQSTNTV